MSRTSPILADVESERLRRERAIDLAGIIDDAVATTVIAQCLFLFHHDATKPVTLRINSDGGSVAAGLAITDFVLEHRDLTDTVCTHRAAGVAAIILGCGAKGGRRAGRAAAIELTPVTVLGAHEPAPGPADLQRASSALACVLADCTGRSLASVTADLENGRTFDAAAALAYGLVDVID